MLNEIVFLYIKIVWTNVDQNLIVNQHNFMAK